MAWSGARLLARASIVRPLYSIGAGGKTGVGLPPSLITAAAAGAASGKNPWLPFGVLFLIAAFGQVPRFLMDPELHAGIHGLAPPWVLLGLAAVFLVLAVLDSFADKVGWIESWLTPLSVAWRPFAAVGVSALIAHAVFAGEDPALLAGAAAPDLGAIGAGASPGGAWLAAPLALAAAVPADWGTAALGVGAESGNTGTAITGGLLFVVTLVVGTLFGLLATIGKIGTRLLLVLVPVPHLKLAHSFLDDLFAFCVTLLGLLLDSGPLSWLAIGAGALYLLVGLVVAPTLARLTYIQFRTAWALVGKARRSWLGEVAGTAPVPAWIARRLAERGEDRERIVAFPAYTYRAPGIGFCRVGYAVWSPTGFRFFARAWFRPRELAVPTARLLRIGVADTATVRQFVVVEEVAPGEMREYAFTLFPALAAEVDAAVKQGAVAAGWDRVRPRSDSARRGLPGAPGVSLGRRYVPAAKAGSLELQGFVTVLVAAAVGVLTVGACVPVGAGYLLSPFKPRFFAGLAVTAYLTLLALTGAGWPVAVLYGVLFNVVALRDLTRQAIKAHVDGYVDRRAFVPPVCGAVYVPRERVLSAQDRGEGESFADAIDGSWRTAVRILRGEAVAAAVAAG